MQRVTRFVAIAGIAGASLLLSASNALAAEIRVCENSRMRPPCINLRHGVNDLSEWGISNSISSFSIESGSWLMCTQPNFGGRCEAFDGSRDNLQGSPFQDSISSLRPVREGGGGNWGGYGGSSEWGRLSITVYSDINYRGRSWVFSDDIRDLSNMGLSNQISSVRVSGGRWRICRQPDFRGCTDVDGDIPDLRDLGLNDRISSIQERGPGGGHGGHGGGGGNWNGSDSSSSGGGWGGSGGDGGSRDSAILYENTGFRGRSVTVNGSSSNLNDLRFNDRARSIRIRGSWQLCSDSKFRGECVSVRGDQEDLSRFGLNGSLSSLRREN